MTAARTILGLSLALLVAAALRFPGVDFLLPLIVEPDPHIPVQVRLIESEHPDPNSVPDWAKYPLLPAYLTAALSEPLAQPDASAPIDEHLAASSWEILRVRWVIAWLSLLLVPATFLIGRRFLPDSWAVAAALLAATSHLAIHFATQARPHGGAAPWPALTVWACLLLVERMSLARYALVTVFGAIAVGTLQSSMALGFPVLAAHMLSGRGVLSKRHLRLLIPVAGLAVALYLTYPFFFNAPPVEVEGKQVQQGGHKIMLGLLNGSGFEVLGWSLWSWDPALAVGLGLGVLTGLLALVQGRLAPRGWKPLLVVLSYVIPYGLVLGLYARSYERFLLPLIPFFAVWTLWSCWQMSRRLRRTGVTLAACLIAASSIVAGRLVQLRLAPNTVEQASEWVAERIPPHGAESEELPVWISRPSVLSIYKSPASDAADEANRSMRGKRQLNWSSYQRDVLGDQRSGPAWDVRFMPMQGMAEIRQMQDNPFGYILRLGTQGWVVNEVYDDGRVHPSLLARTQALRAMFSIVADFRPDHAESSIPHPLVYQEETRVKLYHRSLRVLRGTGFGPVLEIFELQPIQGAR